MSLILDALHKADRERRAEEQAPNLQAIRGTGIPDSRATGRWRVLALVLAALLVCIGLFNLMSAPEEDAALARIERDISAAPAPAPAPASTPEREPRPTVSAAAAAPVDVTPPEASAPARPQSGDAAAPSEVQSLYQASREASVIDSPPRSDWVEPSAEQAAVEEPVGWPEGAEYASLPSILDLPERTRDAIPSIRYTDHRYTGDASSDEVVLNGASLQKGDSVGADLYLVEILDDAIVLEFRGQRFRLTKFNNWINM
jgi:hypothetical protein